MNVIVYHKEYDVTESFDNFRDIYFSSQLKYLASDLLNQGLKPRDIKDAVKRAMAAGKSAGLEMKRHFALVYTQKGSTAVYDCKLSRLGYALVMLNASPHLRTVGEWQVKVLTDFLRSN